MVFKNFYFLAYIFEFLIFILKKKNRWAQSVIFLKFLVVKKYKVICKKSQIFDFGRSRDKWIHIFFLFSAMVFNFVKIFEDLWKKSSKILTKKKIIFENKKKIWIHLSWDLPISKIWIFLQVTLYFLTSKNYKKMD